MMLIKLFIVSRLSLQEQNINQFVEYIMQMRYKYLQTSCKNDFPGHAYLSGLHVQSCFIVGCLQTLLKCKILNS
jgi:hypothetical protein